MSNQRCSVHPETEMQHVGGMWYCAIKGCEIVKKTLAPQPVPKKKLHKTEVMDTPAVPRKLTKKERRAAFERASATPKKLTRAEQDATLQRIVQSMAPVIVQALSEALSALERAQNAFIDGSVASLGAAFVALYLSARNPQADSPEAVAALEACRAAFDACGLELRDIEAVKAPKAKVATKSKSKNGEGASK